MLVNNTVPTSENVEAVSTENPVTSGPTTVSVEEFSEMKSELARVKAALNASHASARVAKKAPEAVESEPNANTVAALRKEIEDRQKTIDKRSITADLNASVSGLKVNPDSIDFVKAFLAQTTEGKIQYNWESGIAEVDTLDELGLKTKIPLSAFIATLDKAGKFNAFKLAPGVDSRKPVQGVLKTSTIDDSDLRSRAETGKLSLDELRKMRKK